MKLLPRTLLRPLNSKPSPSTRLPRFSTSSRILSENQPQGPDASTAKPHKYENHPSSGGKPQNREPIAQEASASTPASQHADVLKQEGQHQTQSSSKPTSSSNFASDPTTSSHKSSDPSAEDPASRNQGNWDATDPAVLNAKKPNTTTTTGSPSAGTGVKGAREQISTRDAVGKHPHRSSSTSTNSSDTPAAHHAQVNKRRDHQHPTQGSPSRPGEVRTLAQIDEEFAAKMRRLAGEAEGGEAGVEYEDGKAVEGGMRRGVRANMFRYI